MNGTRYPLELFKDRIGPVVLLGFLVTVLVMNIGAPFWDDEAATMNLYILDGWNGVMAGNYGINNHRLYSLLSLGSSELLGTSETVIRIWSVVPAVAAAVIFYLWLARRFGRGWALVGTGLLVVNFQFMTLSAQARGYGLVFLGWCLLTTRGLDYLSGRRHADLVVASAGGLVAILTFPLMALPMTLSYMVLWASRRTDPKPLLHLGACGLVSIVWYRDAIDVLIGTRSGFAEHALIDPVGPSDIYDWIFFAGDVIPLNGTVGETVTLAVLLVLTAAAVVDAKRSERVAQAVFLIAPATITLALAWAGGVALWDRYTSFFVFPAVVLVVLGARFLRNDSQAWPILAVGVLAVSSVTAQHFLASPLGARTAAVVAVMVAIAAAGLAFAATARYPVAGRDLVMAGTVVVIGASAWSILDLALSRQDTPLQDFRAVEALIEQRAPETVIVSYPLEALDYYLDRDYTALNRVERPELIPLASTSEQVQMVCAATDAAVVLFNHYDPDEVFDDSCLSDRPDAELHIVPMVRGAAVNVWLVG